MEQSPLLLQPEVEADTVYHDLGEEAEKVVGWVCGWWGRGGIVCWLARRGRCRCEGDGIEHEGLMESELDSMILLYN